MKKIKTILLCVIMAMCAVGVVGCGNDDSNGSSQQTTGAESTSQDRKSTRLNSSHNVASRMPSSA